MKSPARIRRGWITWPSGYSSRAPAVPLRIRYSASAGSPCSITQVPGETTALGRDPGPAAWWPARRRTARTPAAQRDRWHAAPALGCGGTGAPAERRGSSTGRGRRGAGDAAAPVVVHLQAFPSVQLRLLARSMAGCCGEHYRCAAVRVRREAHVLRAAAGVRVRRPVPARHPRRTAQRYDVSFTAADATAAWSCPAMSRNPAPGPSAKFNLHAE
jgi:hypothetical protein